VTYIHISKGFEIAAHKKNKEGKFSLYDMLSQKRGESVPIEVCRFLEKRAHEVDINLMRQQAKLTEEQMDNSNIPINIIRNGASMLVYPLPRPEIESYIDRDMQLIFKQRAICLTEPSIILAYGAEQAKGTEYEDKPALIKQIKHKTNALLQQEASKKRKQEELDVFNALPIEEREKILKKRKDEKDLKAKQSKAIADAAKAIINAKKVVPAPEHQPTPSA
jgi:hypothetical protein